MNEVQGPLATSRQDLLLLHANLEQSLSSLFEAHLEDVHEQKKQRAVVIVVQLEGMEQGSLHVY
jgi:hypothetical protein